MLQVKTNLNGVLISRFDVFCPQLKESRVCIGLWPTKEVTMNPPLGHSLQFDAFFSELRNEYGRSFFSELQTSRWIDQTIFRNLTLFLVAYYYDPTEPNIFPFCDVIQNNAIDCNGLYHTEPYKESLYVL